MTWPAIRRILKRAALVIAGIATLAATAGFLLQQHRDESILAANPPPGEFVDIGGHRLHYQLRGSGTVTFVLESGAGEYSGSWGEVDDRLAETGSVFTYDRAGLGWSEPGPRPRTLEQLASELRAVLSAVGLAPPYVLVGHSLGGAIVVRYALENPSDVAGILLLDPSHRDQFDRLTYPSEWQRRLATEALRLAPLGASLLLPDSPHPIKNRSSHLQAYGAEVRAFMQRPGERTANGADVGAPAPIDFGPTPVIVLSRAPPDSAISADSAPATAVAGDHGRWIAWTELHRELVGASSNEFSRHVVVEGAGHCVHCDRPDAVIDAALDLADHVTRSGAGP